MRRGCSSRVAQDASEPTLEERWFYGVFSRSNPHEWIWSRDPVEPVWYWRSTGATVGKDERWCRPLSIWDVRRGLEGSRRVGCSFGSRTEYLMVDLDYKGMPSPYHPKAGNGEFLRLRRVLAHVGLMGLVLVRSGISGGLHLYLPLDRQLPSYWLARAVTYALTDAGFEITPGRLEIFPNLKPFVPSGKGFSRYAAHALPLQAGSVLFDQVMRESTRDLQTFRMRWESAAGEQNYERLTEAIDQAQNRHRAEKAAKRPPRRRIPQSILDRLAEGWTAGGQTNLLLGLAARVGSCGQGLSAPEALAEWMMQWARSAPGFSQWCGHRDQLRQRCNEWARSALRHEQAFVAMDAREDSIEDGPTYRQRQQATSRARIEAAVAYLQQAGGWPSGATARLRALLAVARGSVATYYKHKDLWHPVREAEKQSESTVTGSPNEGGGERAGFGFEAQQLSLPILIPLANPLPRVPRLARRRAGVGLQLELSLWTQGEQTEIPDRWDWICALAHAEGVFTTDPEDDEGDGGTVEDWDAPLVVSPPVSRSRSRSGSRHRSAKRATMVQLSLQDLYGSHENQMSQPIATASAV